MKDPGGWRLLRPWHLLPVALIVLVMGGSMALGDPRPLLIAFWWAGVGAMGLAIAGGILAGFVLFGVGVWRHLSGNKEKRSASSDVAPSDAAPSDAAPSDAGNGA